MRVLLYTRHNMTKWIRYVAANLTFASSTIIMSELRNEGDVSTVDDFNRYYHQSDIAEQAVTKFGESACNDIILRCRLLRSLDRRKSLKMIGSTWRACDDLIKEVNPDLFVGLRIDSYVLDVIDRILRERGIPYIGLWRAALVPNMIFFTTRGEHIPLREPTEEEVEKCILSIIDHGFKATSLRKDAKYDFLTFFKKRIYYTGRDIFLDIQRWIERDPLGYRYLTSGRHVAEYKVGLRDWRVVKCMDWDWQKIFETIPFEKRVFIGLQVNPEATIDYYVKNLELIDYQGVLMRLVKVLGDAGYKIFVKDHPNMFGQRRLQFYESLSASGGDSVVFLPYDVSSNYLVKNSYITYTWTGTIGLQSAMDGNCPVIVDPTYYIPGPFLKIQTLADIDQLPLKIGSFIPPSDIDNTRRELARRILRSFIPGSMKYKEFAEGDPNAIKETTAFISSLNFYLPGFAL